MNKLVILGVCFPLAALGSPGKSAVLSETEANTMCAEALPKQLACKEEFCTSMVALRRANDPRFAGKDADATSGGPTKAKCLEEIALDGTGDLATRTSRCAGWTKGGGSPKVGRADADAMTACWNPEKSCADQVACWAPKMGEVMKANASKASSAKPSSNPAK